MEPSTTHNVFITDQGEYVNRMFIKRYIWGFAERVSDTGELHIHQLDCEAFIYFMQHTGGWSKHDPDIFPEIFVWEVTFHTDIANQDLPNGCTVSSDWWSHSTCRKVERLNRDDVLVHVVEQKLEEIGNVRWTVDGETMVP